MPRYNSEIERIIFDVLYPSAIRMLESYVAAELQKVPVLDFATNIAAGGLRGGGIDGNIAREIIFDEYGRIMSARRYNLSEGDEPIKDAEDILFDRSGAIVGYSERISKGTGKRVTRVERDKLFEQFGGLQAMTGGIFPGSLGDVIKYDPKDRSTLYKISEEIAIDYYKDQAKLIGFDHFGRKLFKAEVPVTENPFKILDPREYDLSLMFKYLKQGMVYSLLNLFGNPAKITLFGLGFAPDPAIETQAEVAYLLSKDDLLGNMALTLYPLMLLYNIGKSLAGYPDKPAGKKKSQNIFIMPSKYEFDDESILPSEGELYTIQLRNDFSGELVEAA